MCIFNLFVLQLTIFPLLFPTASSLCQIHNGPGTLLVCFGQYKGASVSICIQTLLFIFLKKRGAISSRQITTQQHKSANLSAKAPIYMRHHLNRFAQFIFHTSLIVYHPSCATLWTLKQRTRHFIYFRQLHCSLLGQLYSAVASSDISPPTHTHTCYGHDSSCYALAKILFLWCFDCLLGR